MIYVESINEEEKIVKLTDGEIEEIIRELEGVPHNVYEFFNCGSIIEKLKKARMKKYIPEVKNVK